MNKLFENLILAGTVATVVAASTLVTSGQTPPSQPPRTPIVTAAPNVDPVSPVDRRQSPAPFPVPNPPTRGSSEKSIKVDSNVNLWLGCVREGKVRVNGWNRNEVRVLVQDGNKIEFRTLQESSKTGEPVWIKLVGVDAGNKFGISSECIQGSEIEIDAPVNSTITVKGIEISTSIDNVKRVDIESIGGDVSVRNIANGVKVVAHQGDITVEASEGAMMLNTTTGNILVFEAGPSEIGDGFKANTHSGAVALQTLDYRQASVESVTGSLAYTGNLPTGGSYNMRTSKGSIRMTLPLKSSFQMWATYGSGNFSSELPIDIATENISPGPIKSIRGKCGNGEATLKLSTNNGSIGIKKM